MKVLCTGGCGFIGSHITDLLIATGYEVVVIDNLSAGHRSNLNPQAKLYEADITSAAAVAEVFEREQPEVVIHHAAQVDVGSSMNDPYHDALTNIIGSVNLLQSSVQNGVRKIIYASSCAVYGLMKDEPISEAAPVQPLSFYGLSKFIPEQYIQMYHRQYGLGFTILRYANVYGPRQSLHGEGGVISIFARKAANGEAPVIYGDGHQTRDFVFVKDVARANLLSIERGDQEVLNIGTNVKTSLNDLAGLISAQSPGLKPPLYLEAKAGDIRFSRLDASKAGRLLGWSPLYDLRTGLGETLEFYGLLQEKGDC
ncbi:NAD-dependent epimerase/dehydratase family protein [Paenibacillus pinistramenti]|uniref:NAD-dependent epimerase/dehydratase family protein n=1 Tax=Paenibacillus pinistramenti TaxID=1768003 RepID=UPI0011087242|nr:NAD-dependent epimerase/dehydratase family protein [Paenibacillus pinistramenti]